MFKFIENYKAKRATKKRLAELEREKKEQLDHWVLLTMIDLEYSYYYSAYGAIKKRVTANVYINKYYRTVHVSVTGGGVNNNSSYNRLPAMDIYKLLATLE